MPSLYHSPASLLYRLLLLFLLCSSAAEAANLLANPQLLPATGNSPAPEGWYPPPAADLQDSSVNYGLRQERLALGLTAGYDRQAVWRTALPDCPAGATYLFTGEFWRDDREDPHAYPEIVLWGRKYLLNTHRMTGTFQQLKGVITCPAEYRAEERFFEFRNGSPGNSLWMRAPQLQAWTPPPPQLEVAPDTTFFPLGVYGASAENLAEIGELGLNTAVVALTEANLRACLTEKMRCTLAVPRDPERLAQSLTALQPLLEQGRFSFYVNDEPEIHAFPEADAAEIHSIVKHRFPDAATGMAIVRPQAIPFYEQGADYFMLDQYPVPHMPMTWLAESMSEAASHVGRHRLQAVIQAFGGGKYADFGWPRLPTFAEMNCLAFLSVIHGSRGIYFYTWPSITATAQGREDLARLVSRLNSLSSWLRVVNHPEPVVVQMTSANRFDPRGNPAVQCAAKEQYATRMLICVNTIATFTEATIDIPVDRSSVWREYFLAEPYPVFGGTILTRFSPYEVKVLLETK
jgi:hypothetical protein